MKMIIIILLSMITVYSQELTKDKLEKLLPSGGVQQIIKSERIFELNKRSEFAWIKKYKIYTFIGYTGSAKVYFSFAYDGSKVLQLSYDSEANFCKNFITILEAEKQSLNKAKMIDFFNLFTVYGKDLYIVKALKGLDHVEIKDLNIKEFPFIIKEDKDSVYLSFYYLTQFSLKHIKVSFSKEDQKFTVKDEVITESRSHNR